MLQLSIAAAYAAMNILLAVIIYTKSRQNILSKFYLFCINCLTCFGVIGYLFSQPLKPELQGVLEPVAVFIFALLPFFFLHFIVIFIRRKDILEAKHLIAAIYFAGLFSYTMVLLHFIPTPIVPRQGLSPTGYIYYFTWMSIFFCIGIALLYSTIDFFFKRRVKSKLLFTGFASLMLFLPSPFTESLWLSIFRQNTEWFFSSSMVALIIAVYFIFRHKIITDTPYDALKSALGVMNDVLIKTNQDFEIEMAKGAVVPMLGYTEKELMGKPFSNLVKDRDAIESYNDYVRRGKMKEALIDLEVESKQTDHLLMNFSFSPMFEGDEVTGFVALGRNITEQKRLEEHLRQAQKIESIGTLASGIAHDFNNILNIIKGYTAFIKETGYAPGTVPQSVESIDKATNKGSDLVQQILTFARKGDVSLESINANETINEVVKMLTQTFPKTVTFVRDLLPDVPFISANPNQVQQALVNLCVNARDAMPNGGVLTICSGVVNGERLKEQFSDAADDKYPGSASRIRGPA